MYVKFSEDANELILKLYNAYLNKCANGVSNSDAEFFGDDTNITFSCAISWNSYKLNENLKELWKNNFIYACEHDEHICQVRLNYYKIIEYLDDKLIKNLRNACEFS